MKRKEFIKTVIVLSTVAALSAVIIIGATLAWFVFKPKSVSLRQEIEGWWFQVEIDDNNKQEEYNAAWNIDITNVYPIANSVAMTKIKAGEFNDNMNTLIVENVGTIDSIYRYYLDLRGSSNAKSTQYLYDQLCYSYKKINMHNVDNEPVDMPDVGFLDWTEPQFLTNEGTISKTGNVSLQEALDDLLLQQKTDEGGNPVTDDEGKPVYIHTDNAVLRGRRNFDEDAFIMTRYHFCFWLHQDATLESANDYVLDVGGNIQYDSANKPLRVGKTATIELKIHAKQLYANATWSDINVPEDDDSLGVKAQETINYLSKPAEIILPSPYGKSRFENLLERFG